MLSVKTCNLLNLGIASERHTLTIERRTTIATAVTTVHAAFLFEILIIAQIAVNGAFISICIPMTINSCICVTSFVVLVIKLAVEKELTSFIEKDITFLNSADLVMNEKLEAIFAAIIATTTEMARLPNAQRSIMNPAEYMSPMALPSVWTSRVISDI